jgi:hypothetical protein
MRPARGDTKPCTQPACTGVMQYARPPLGASGWTRANDALQWLCSVDRSHGSYPTDDAPVARPAVPR